MQAYHLALLPWSAFVSLTSGRYDPVRDSWHYAPKSARWWQNATIGFLRESARQHHIQIKDIRFVRRLEDSESLGLLHCHILLWTGKPWSKTDAFRALSLWSRPDNGTKNVRVYDSTLAGASYILKGLHYTEDSMESAFQYELKKTERLGAFGGIERLMLDLNTRQEILRRCNRGAVPVTARYS